MLRNYWLDLFTHQTWCEFLAAGADVTGFRESRWKQVQSIKSGDILLCYLTGVSRWIGIIETTGSAFKNSKPIWKDNDFPCRLPVKIISKLEVEFAVPVLGMSDQLSAFRDMKSQHAWTGRFRGSPTRWTAADGEAVMAAVADAVARPVFREYDRTKLRKVPPILRTDTGQPVTIPDDTDLDNAQPDGPRVRTTGSSNTLELSEATAHTEIQWLLLKLGSDMGLDVWVAKNDRNKNYLGRSFSDIPRIVSSLPLQFDEPTTKTIELIDVIWLKGNSIQSAFEIESTTAIFSGLLRMSDLVTMQPNLNIPLYIVAPSERRNKVIAEINRPTFAKRDKPMVDICKFIAFDELQKQCDAAKAFLKHLRPDFLDDFAESCTIDEV